MRKLILFTLLMLLPVSGWGATFYIDPAGDDGVGSEADPFDQWSDVTWTAGNTYKQKAGTTAREQVTVGAANVTITSYDTGDAPIISGATLKSDAWTAVGGHIYSVAITALAGSYAKDVSQVYFTALADWGIKVMATPTNDKEFYFRSTDGTLFIHCEAGDPFATWGNAEIGHIPFGVLAAGKSNVTVDGLEFKYQTECGVAISETASTCEIKNCAFTNIGGLFTYRRAADYTWTQEAAKVWYCTTNTPYQATATTAKGVYFDNVQKTTPEDNAGAVNGAGKWFYGSGKLYIYVDADATPATDTGQDVVWWQSSPRLVAGNGVQFNTNGGTGQDALYVHDCTFSHISDIAISLEGSYAADGIDVYNNTIANCGGNGVQIANEASVITKDAHIYNNSISYIAPAYTWDNTIPWNADPYMSGDGHGILTRSISGGTMENCIIEYNDVSYTSTTANSRVNCAVRITSKNTTDASKATYTIRYNKIHNTNSHGIRFHNDPGTTTKCTAYVYGNVLYSTYYRGIDVSNESTIYAYNNTLYACGTGDATYPSIHNRYSPYLTLKNNIVQISAGVVLDTDAGATTESDYNCFYNGSGNLVSVGATNYTNAEQATYRASTTPANVCIFANPLFNTGGYSLAGDSPCINAGANLGSSYDDALYPAGSWPSDVRMVDQDAAGFGTGWEIGAYVYDEATVR